jgi:hypothetical protein
VDKSELEYWDYNRETELDGVKTVQYLYVEMNKKNGWFQIKRGEELDPSRVMVF